LRIKEQETRLTLQEHDDDDDEFCPSSNSCESTTFQKSALLPFQRNYNSAVRTAALGASTGESAALYEDGSKAEIRKVLRFKNSGNGQSPENDCVGEESRSSVRMDRRRNG